MQSRILEHEIYLETTCVHIDCSSGGADGGCGVWVAYDVQGEIVEEGNTVRIVAPLAQAAGRG